MVHHDAFRWYALGKAGLDVWLYLMQPRVNGAIIKDIAEATGRHRNTVSRKLKRMLKLGLVEALGDGYWRACPDADLAVAAEELGTAGKVFIAPAKSLVVRPNRLQIEKAATAFSTLPGPGSGKRTCVPSMMKLLAKSL